MLEDAPGSPTHKATPGAADDLKNWVLLKMRGDNTLEVHSIDEAFNFRPTVRHRVYTLEEAELLMSAKKKSKMTAKLKAQIETSERKAKQTDMEESSAMGGPSVQEASHSEESDREIQIKKQQKKKKYAIAGEREQRPPRGPQEVMATDDLIEEIRPTDVEDWEFSEDEADDDLYMGADFEEEEKDEMEAEYKQHFDSDTSEDEEGSKLDDKGKELKRLIKNGAPEYVPTSSSPDTKKRKMTEAINKDEKSTKKGHSTEQPTTKIKLTVPQRGEVAENNPKGLTEEELCRFLRSKGPIDLKQLIGAFKKFFSSSEEKRGFINILKKLTLYEERNGTKFVALKEQYL